MAYSALSTLEIVHNVEINLSLHRSGELENFVFTFAGI